MKYLICLAALLWAGMKLTAADNVKEVEIKIIETSDVHGNFFPYNFIERKEWNGSLARVYSYVKEQRKLYGDNCILVDNGDILQGQPTAYYYNFIDTVSTHVVAEIQNFMGYAVGNMGNHDVETGHAVYDRWIKQCKFPVLGANIVDNVTGKPYLKPYEIINRDGVKIAILGMIESLLCGASAGRMTGVRLDANQELIAQGVGNILLPFFGGIPATAAIARTSVAIKSGAKTRLTGVFHAVGLLISMFLLAPVMSRIPLAALAGVLMVTAWRMNEWESIRYIFSHKFKGAMLEFTATMFATIIFDLTVAILIGVLIGLVFLVSRLSFIEINYESVDMNRMHVTDPVLCERYSNAKVVYITGPMIFANTQAVADIAGKVEGSDTVLFSMRGVSNIDISCAQTLRELVEGLRKKGVDVAICGMTTHAMKMMDRTDLHELIGDENFYWSVERVLLTNRPRPAAKVD